MSTAKPPARAGGSDQVLYQATLQEAADAGALLMGKLVEAGRVVLQVQEAGLRDLRQRDGVAVAAKLLRRHEQQLCMGYPKALLAAFASPGGRRKPALLSVAEVHFDQLELMDDAQVQSTVTLARIQQGALHVAQDALAELNTLICSVQGLGVVRAEHNPLRPEVYVHALKEAVEETDVPSSAQLIWFNAMAQALGPGLSALYERASERLRQQGVVSVSYAIPSGFCNQGGAAGASVLPRVAVPTASLGATSQPALGAAQVPPARGRDQTLLTLDKLHRLLSGDLAPATAGNRVDQFAAQFARQFEDSGPASPQGPASDFAATVPAALEALAEMKQLDRVVHNLEQRRAAATDPVQPHSAEGQRLELCRNARDVAQALSLEVVMLMVDNMAHDARLLEPVRAVIRNLEPALLRLALVDQRFFTDKQHPARRLLQALTQRSMAFDSEQSAGFATFLQELQDALAPLFRSEIESAEVFERTLVFLQQQWSQVDQVSARARAGAVAVLRHAEARNLLAEKIAHNIESQPEASKVPAVVIEFLCGPWAQVVAQGRIQQGAGSAAVEKFEALISALLWSAHPELARHSPAKLTRLVPRLLATLREGLDTIAYPATGTSAFLEALMALHQQVFRANSALAPVSSIAVMPARKVQGDPWMAPQEALLSNFVALQESTPALVDAAVPLRLPEVATDAVADAMTDTIDDALDFPLGSWVQMWSKDQWLRTQLTWASPYGTLFLFTGVFGNTQSMSRRSRDALLASGRLRLLTGQAVDEGALDAVAQTAMRNSVNSMS